MTVRTPVGLNAGGRSLWRAITVAHDLDAAQLVQLTEACRAKDRLDGLDEVLRGDPDVWCRFKLDEDSGEHVLKIDAALAHANTTANLMKQLLAALRLPDEQTGRRPIVHPPRGAVQPQRPGGSVKDRLRAVSS